MSIQKRFLFFVVLFSLISCQNATKSYENLKIFRYNEHSNISSLDPIFARTQSNIWAVNQLFNGLVQLDDSLQIQPDIAKKWQLSDDGKTYTFTLRNDVFFHKNVCFSEKNQTRKVIAEDFVYSFYRLIDDKWASSGRWILQNVTHFSAPNDTTFCLVLKEKQPTFLGLLTSKYASVVAKEAVNFYGTNFGRNPVGTGAFRFQFWEENNKLILQKNPMYHEFIDSLGQLVSFEQKTQKSVQQLPFLDGISITFLPEKQSEFLQFLQGKLDFLNSVDASYKDEILTSQGELSEKYKTKFQMVKTPFLNTEYLGFTMDNSSEIAKNQALRKAIHYGFDRHKMMQYLRNNIGKPATGGVIPIGLTGFSDFQTQYQPQIAKEIVENYQKKHKKKPQLTLTTDANYVDICEYIQRELQLIGFNCKVDVVPPSTLRQGRAMGKLQVFRGSWIADYPDAENYLSLFYSKNFSPNGANYTHFKNTNFDAWYEMLQKETSAEKRTALYHTMDSLLMEHLPFTPLYYDENIRLLQNSIKGLTSNPINLLHLKKVNKIEKK